MKKTGANAYKDKQNRNKAPSLWSFVSLGVGEPYPLPVGNEGATANFLIKEGNLLQINIPNITPREIKALKKGVIKAGFLYEGGDLLWLFSFLDRKRRPVFTLDAPFDARVIPSDVIALHDITNDKNRLAIEIHVVDSGITKALRVVTLSNKMTIKFLSAVQDQLSSISTGVAMNSWMQRQPDTLMESTQVEVLGM